MTALLAHLLGMLTPEGWGYMATVTVAAITGGVTVAKVRRTPYGALARRVVLLEEKSVDQDKRIEQLEGQLRAEREAGSRERVAFRARLQELLRFITQQDEYIGVLLDIVRQRRIPMGAVPSKPELPPSSIDDL